MSLQLINHSPDLKRLQEEGYDIEERSGFLFVKDVPYVTPTKEIKRGTLVCKLNLSADKTNPPDDHTIQFIGEMPCDHNGTSLEKALINEKNRREIVPGIFVDFGFSAKPTGDGRYVDYYAKIVNYASILSGPAQLYPKPNTLLIDK